MEHGNYRCDLWLCASCYRPGQLDTACCGTYSGESACNTPQAARAADLEAQRLAAEARAAEEARRAEEARKAAEEEASRKEVRARVIV